jgi:hypothetical protein
LSSVALQHFRIKKRPFRVSFEITSTKHARSRSASILRVWLPSRWFSLFPSLGAYFSSQRSWAFPFKAFLFRSGRQRLSTLSLRSRALVQNLPALYWRPSSFIPERKPYSFLQPDGLNRGGAVCSLGVVVFKGYSLNQPPTKYLSSSVPFSSFVRSPLPNCFRGPQGCQASPVRRLPQVGASLFGLWTDFHCPPF